MFKKMLIAASLSFLSVAHASDVPDQLPCSSESAEIIAARVAAAMEAYVDDSCEGIKGKKAQLECKVQVASDYFGFYIDIMDLDYQTALAVAKQSVEISKKQKDSRQRWYYNGFGRIFDTTIDAKGCFMSQVAAYEVMRSIGGTYYVELNKLK